ncbi:MAG TPA: sulfite exporter TauE/SafE family protein, partial [Gammaproteobacteria bacterium]|nr:sulfite exporter TauE/SafE family protein [Gammaproteobacteria bacterium]
MLEILTLPQLLFACATLVLAYVVRGITGFGSALIAVPLLA